MSTFGDDLIQAMTEALAHAKDEGPAVVHAEQDVDHDDLAHRDPELGVHELVHQLSFEFS